MRSRQPLSTSIVHPAPDRGECPLRPVADIYLWSSIRSGAGYISALSALKDASACKRVMLITRLWLTPSYKLRLLPMIASNKNGD